MVLGTAQAGLLGGALLAAAFPAIYAILMISALYYRLQGIRL